MVVYRLFRDVEGESSISYGLQNCGTSGAPSPTDLRLVGDFGTSGVLSPTDLGCEEFWGCGGCCRLGVGVCGFGNESAGYDSLKSLSIKS